MKYRHRGYQDDEYKRERKRDEGPKKKVDDGMPPRSRLFEKRMATLVFRCHECGHQDERPGEIGVADTCPHCGSALHCCMNCGQFAPGIPRECKDPRVTTAIFSKRAANECPHFEPRAVLDSTGRRQEAARPPTARQAFDDLFKKK